MLGIMIDMTQLYIFDSLCEWLWPSLKVTGVCESWNLCDHSFCKVIEVAQKFAVVDYVREMSAKTFKYVRYGLFDHLVF